MADKMKHRDHVERFLQALESVKRSLETGEGRHNVESFERRVVDIPALRARYGMTQQQFADAFGIAIGTMRNWEQGRRVPDGPAQRLLEIIEDRPDVAAQVLSTNPMGEAVPQSVTVETVTEAVCLLKPSRRDFADKEKRNCLRALIDREGDKLMNAIIFCNRKRDVSIVQKSLSSRGYNAGALHGDLDRSVRLATLDAFRDGEIKFLVASDVAARGLSIPSVSHVFNFDVPTHSEDYVHRIGRTGREGTVVSICLPFEGKYLGFIEELLGRDIPRIDVPAGIEQVQEGSSGNKEDGSIDLGAAQETPAVRKGARPARSSRARRVVGE